ncbi:MAG TPA: CheR family methyltransferase [Methylocella sp.]|nr:CheR family methyltransferase [Methylocella sp.]
MARRNAKPSPNSKPGPAVRRGRRRAAPETKPAKPVVDVTGFFRDPDAFAALAEHILDALRSHPADQTFRAWVAGCGTGEEAYTLGILLLEQLTALGLRFPVRIFATDIDDEALEVARAGIYPENIRADVSEDRLSRFFTRKGGRLRVSSDLRRAVMFARHDLPHDPPFARLDLVFCRNMLMDLTPGAQLQVLAKFNFGLVKGGLLMLGSAESAHVAEDLFEPLDEKSRIYCRRGYAAFLQSSAVPQFRTREDIGEASRDTAMQSSAHAEKMQGLLLRTYTPAAVTVGRHLKALATFGAIERYLQFIPGDLDRYVLPAAAGWLRAELREAISRAFRTKRRVTVHAAWSQRRGTAAPVTIEAQPVPDEHDDLVLVAFLEDLPPTVPGKPAPGDKAELSPEASSIAQKLADTRRELNRTINELRETTETLKASNERAMSLNEEFLTTNEELQSSRQELQSLNEELTAVNNQLRKTLEQQQRTANDLSNLLNSSSVATILLDEELNIKIFNPRMRELFSLIETDIGRPLVDLLPQFSDPELTADALAARSSGTSREREIHALSGAWYMRSVMPYRTDMGEIRGAVVTYTDVTRLKEEQILSQAARRYAELIVETAAEPMAAIDESFRLVSANEALCAAIGVRKDQLGKASMRDLESPVLTHPPLLELISQMLTQGEGITKSDIEVTQPKGGQHSWRATIRAFRAPPPQSPIVLLALEDITDQRRVIRRQFQLLMEALPGPVLATDPQGRIRFVSAQVEGLFGHSTAELLGQTVDMLIPPELRARHAALHMDFLKQPTRRSMGTSLEIDGIAKDGTRIPLDIGLSPVETADGPLVIAALHDLREHKKGEAEREHLRAQLAADLTAMERLHEMATRLAETAELPELLREILNATIELQHADLGNIQLYDPETDSLKIAVQKGFSRSFLEHFAIARRGDGSVCARAMEAGTRVVVEDVEDDVAYAPHRSVAAAAGYRAVQSTPIFTHDGTLMGVLSTHFRGPHQLVERDRRMTDLFMHMAAALIERTQAEAVAEAARLAANEANRAKSRFLAAAGHDLRQPLQSIGLLQGLLEAQVASPQARATLARLGDATEQMTELIDALLDLNQIESGGIKLELTDLSVAPLLTQVVHDFTPLASAKGLELRCVPVASIIRGDRRLLVRMLCNLVSNAVKYTDNGKILTGCRRRGNNLRIEVWDTGIGIPPDKINAVFDEFYRVDEAEGDKFGFGLGLHIVKRFANLLGYQIDIRSTLGKGTMFAVVIPNVDFSGAASPKAVVGKEIAASGPAILLVEDDATQLHALTSLLELQGYQIAAAPNEVEAMAHLRGNTAPRPNVVIADFNLPGGSTGVDIVRHVRDELNAEIPALILSGEQPEAQLSSSKAGELQVLRKPVRPATLLATVEVLVKRTMPAWQGCSAGERRMAGLPSAPNPLSEIAVIDDEPILRDSIRAMLESQGYKVETFTSGEAFLSDPDHGRFRCLVVDVSLAGMGGLELQSRLKLEQRYTPIIFLTASGDVPLAVRAMREGAADFLQKPVDSVTLRQSIASAMEQGSATVATPSQRADTEARLATLTKREREIMDRIVMGQLNKNIATELGISERTTEHHRQSLMRKIGVTSLAMLVRLVTATDGNR